MFIIDSDDSENDADAEIIELPPEIISPLEEKPKPTRKTRVADLFKQALQINREKDLLLVNTPQTRQTSSSQATAKSFTKPLNEKCNELCFYDCINYDSCKYWFHYKCQSVSSYFINTASSWSCKNCKRNNFYFYITLLRNNDSNFFLLLFYV